MIKTKVNVNSVRRDKVLVKMKLLQKPIDTMVVFQVDDEHPRPWKFKIEEDDGEKVTVMVDQIIYSHKSKVCGADNILYHCQSTINGKDRRFELKYFCSRCQWQLYKM